MLFTDQNIYGIGFSGQTFASVNEKGANLDYSLSFSRLRLWKV